MSEEIVEVGKEIDISDEIYRLYRFPKGETAMLKKPKSLVIDEKGIHHITDKAGYTHSISPGWIHLKYKKEGNIKEVVLNTKHTKKISKKIEPEVIEEKKKE